MTSTKLGSEGMAGFGESVRGTVVSCCRLGVLMAACFDGISKDSFSLVCYE